MGCLVRKVARYGQGRKGQQNKIKAFDHNREQGSVTHFWYSPLNWYPPLKLKWLLNDHLGFETLIRAGKIDSHRHALGQHTKTQAPVNLHV
jgi:hypothetical protein